MNGCMYNCNCFGLNEHSVVGRVICNSDDEVTSYACFETSKLSSWFKISKHMPGSLHTGCEMGLHEIGL